MTPGRSQQKKFWTNTLRPERKNLGIIQKADQENKDRDFLRTRILEMYANPLKNHLEADSL